MLLLQLGAVLFREERFRRVEEIVNPGQVKKALVDCLFSRINFQTQVAKLAPTLLPTTNTNPTSFATVHFRVYLSFL